MDITTIISVVLPEVGIGILLYYLLGESRRSRVDEVIDLIDACEKFSHLRGHMFSVYPRPFNHIFYYIEHKSTKQYYEAPTYIEHMIDRDLTVTIKHSNERQMKLFFEKNTVQRNDRKPLPTELLAIKQ